MYRLDKFLINISHKKIRHRDEEYQETGFNTLLEMQSKHFWYLGRHKFILESLKRFEPKPKFSVVDLGGGCGGWIQFLKKNIPDKLERTALADSSRVALLNAKKIIGRDLDAYQVDLMELEWESEWDVAFLLDVIEHCPDDKTIVAEAAKALKSGGKLIITTPALDCFWSHNDIYAKHLRRYNKKQFQELANSTGLVLRDARYFMFFLSPLLWLSRKTKSKSLTKDEILKAIEKEHAIPHWLLNFSLSKLFNAETPLGHILNFPWGTSIIGIFEKK